MRVAITGATGFIGRRLCQRLSERGDSLVILSRNPERARPSLPHGADFMSWEPFGNLLNNMSGAEAIIHLAGETVGGRWNDEKKRLIRDSRVLGTRNIVDSMKQIDRKPAVLLSASAIGYYGDRGDEELDENSAPGQSFLTEVCTAWEAEAMKAAAIGVRVAIVRIGLVLGPEGGVLKQILPPFMKGVGGPLGSGKQWVSWIHLEDLVGIFIHALENANASGPLNGVSPHPLRNVDLSKALGKVLHRPSFIRTPAAALKLLLGEFAEVTLQSQRVLPRRTIECGYPFQYPLVESALAQILRKR